VVSFVKSNAAYLLTRRFSRRFLGLSALDTFVTIDWMATPFACRPRLGALGKNDAPKNHDSLLAWDKLPSQTLDFKLPRHAPPFTVTGMVPSRASKNTCTACRSAKVSMGCEGVGYGARGFMSLAFSVLGGETGARITPLTTPASQIPHTHTDTMRPRGAIVRQVSDILEGWAGPGVVCGWRK